MFVNSCSPSFRCTPCHKSSLEFRSWFRVRHFFTEYSSVKIYIQFVEKCPRKESILVCKERFMQLRLFSPMNIMKASCYFAEMLFLKKTQVHAVLKVCVEGISIIQPYKVHSFDILPHSRKQCVPKAVLSADNQTYSYISNAAISMVKVYHHRPKITFMWKH